MQRISRRISDEDEAEIQLYEFVIRFLKLEPMSGRYIRKRYKTPEERKALVERGKILVYKKSKKGHTVVYISKALIKRLVCCPGDHIFGFLAKEAAIPADAREICVAGVKIEAYPINFFALRQFLTTF